VRATALPCGGPKSYIPYPAEPRCSCRRVTCVEKRCFEPFLDVLTIRLRTVTYANVYNCKRLQTYMFIFRGLG
jgi:hypothetical protein